MKLREMTIASLACMSLIGCEINKEESGELPDVDVEVDSGKLPEYNVNWADVDIGTRTKTVKVPKLEVVMEEETVEVPYVDVSIPDTESVERTVTVEVEVPHDQYNLDIKEIYAVDGELVTVSELSKTGEAKAESVLRIADRVVMNAPNWDVRHIVVGRSELAGYNDQIRFISDRAELEQRFKAQKLLYSDSNQANTKL